MPPHATAPDAQVELAVTGVIDLGLTMGQRARRRDPTSGAFGGSIAFATHTPAGPATARFFSRGPRVGVDAWGPGAAHVLARAATLAGLHDRPLDFDPGHPELAKLVQRFPGLRMTAGANPVEVATHAVFGQRVTSREAADQWARFVYRYGRPAPGPLRLRLPPAHSTVAALHGDDLRRIGVDPHRARTVLALARESDRFVLDDRDLVIARLRALPGIGPWTVGLVDHFAFGNPSALPVGDWHIGRDVCFALAGELYGDDRRMLELLAPFRGNEGRVWRLLWAAGIHHPRRAPGRAPNPLLARSR